MTGEHTTPAAGGAEPADGTEAAVRRWLGDLVDGTATDPEAWDKIQTRIAAPAPAAEVGTTTTLPDAADPAWSPATARRPWGRPRLALALAAAIVLVVAAAVVVGRDQGPSRFSTAGNGGDDRSTIPLHDDTSSSAPSTTSTTLPPGAGDATGQAPSGGTGQAAATGTSAPGAAASGPPAGGTPTTVVDDGPVPAVTATTSDYVLEAYFAGETADARLHATLRRGDLYNPNKPSPWELPISWPLNPAPPAGGACASVTLVGTGASPLGDHYFAAGLAGHGIDAIDVVMTDGFRYRAEIGAGPGNRPVRAWLVEIPGLSVDRVEAFDASRQHVLTLAWDPGATTPPPNFC